MKLFSGKDETMISTNVCLENEVKQFLIKAAAVKGISVESLASEIINAAIREQFNIIPEDTISTPQRKPVLAGTQPFSFLATSEESGIPVDEWEMEK
jgi:hypothetical protein